MEQINRVALFMGVSLAGTVALAGNTELIAARVANFREIGTAFKQVNDELKRGQADLARIRESAQVIKERGARMMDWFVPGSEPPAPVDIGWWDRIRAWLGADDGFTLPEEAKTKARIEAWTERKELERAHAAFLLQADQFWQAAQGTDTSAIRLQARELGERCKSCHKKFRLEED